MEIGRWLAVREREGLTYRELAQRSGIRAGTLGHWAWRLRRERAEVPKRGRGFVELVTATATQEGPSSRVEIVLRGERRVIVDAGIEAEALARVLAAVARC
jgi:transcriptional regulator with XRE-family HTH domain